MNKWSRKLDKELNKYYSELMQDSINWFPDVEDDESYTWVFTISRDSKEKHRWTIDKQTEKITKTIQ